MTEHQPKSITFTGVDERTDLARCKALCEAYPVEFGILMGGNPAKNRYPSNRVLTEFAGTDIPKALHLCKDAASDAGSGNVSSFFTNFDRVQVNLPDDHYCFQNLIDAVRGRDFTFIVQIRNGFHFAMPGVNQLCDRSAGRGLRGKNWPKAPAGDFVGYAGGITPQNVTEVISEIKADNYWIDMESGVRTDDWFDLDKCEAVCRAVYGEPQPVIGVAP